MSFNFEINTKLIFGTNSIMKISSEVEAMNLKRCLIVTDDTIVKLDFLKIITEQLTAKKISYSVYSSVNTEPTDAHVDDGLRHYREGDCDGVIAIGGGSVLDAAKAIAIMVKNEGDISDYKGLNKVINKKVPLIAVPTTAGTGSEVTRALGLTSLKRNEKIVILDPKVAPELAIDDPSLTITLPKGKTAETGIDAFTHAVEAFISKQSNPVSGLLSKDAIQKILRNLPAAWSEGENIEARSNMMLAQYIAGISVANAGVCLVHGMGRPLGLHFNIPHGLANTILLPFVMKYNIEKDNERYIGLQKIVSEGLGENNSKHDLAADIDDFCKQFQLPKIPELIEDEIKYKELVPTMARECLASGSPGNNPYVPDVEDVEKLYFQIYR